MVSSYVSCLLAKGSRSVINLSLIPFGRLASFLTRQFFTAKPTPDSRRSFAFRPFQKNVYPAPISVSCPSSARHVSLRAAIYTLYMDSSFATKTVLVIGLSAAALYMSVRTFRAPNVRVCTLKY